MREQDGLYACLISVINIGIGRHIYGIVLLDMLAAFRAIASGLPHQAMFIAGSDGSAVAAYYIDVSP